MRVSEVEVCKVRQRLEKAPIGPVEPKVKEALSQLGPALRPGMTVALAVGSRGISRLQEIIRQLVQGLRAKGVTPFIVPSMGSHGGATAAGQEAVLAGYGIREDTVGAPIRAGMEVVSIGRTPGGVPVYMDALAHSADGVIVLNRVKPHTDFTGAHESGIVKMLVIGLGKQRQAAAIHALGPAGLAAEIPAAARIVLETGKIIGGVALLEDSCGNLCDLAAATQKEFFALDRTFLRRAKELAPRLPFDRVDTLVVDRMGKDLSGTGMDPWVIGRKAAVGPEQIHCSRVTVLELTKASHGNALGMGLADVIPQSFLEQVNFDVTYRNVLTSGLLERGALPVVVGTHAQAVEAALRASFPKEPAQIRLARIQDTLHLEEMYVSRKLLQAATAPLEQISDWSAIHFDPNGRIAAF